MTDAVAVKDDAQPVAAERAEALLVRPDQLPAAVEAVLITTERPVPAARIAEALGLQPAAEVGPDSASAEGESSAAKPASKRRKPNAAAPDGSEQVIGAIRLLNEQYEATGRSFRIEEVAGGYRLMTLPAFAPVVAAFHKARSSAKLSRASIETLAIVAYKQPLTRAHLEAIRGVACGEVLRTLMERRLVTIKGRAEELGRPMLYGTTREFLDAFGLASLKDLPTATELQVAP